MKTASIITVLSLALLAGCSSTAPHTAKAPTKPKAAEENIIIPYTDNMPPGSMEVTWTPREEAPPPEVKPRKADAQPEWVTKKRSLFVLPTTYSAQ